MRLLVILLATAAFSCANSTKKEPATIVVNESDIITETLGVEGMTCVGCEVTLEKSLSKIKGVVHVKASAKDDQAVIAFDSTKTDLPTIVEKIAEAGYKPVKKQ